MKKLALLTALMAMMSAQAAQAALPTRSEFLSTANLTLYVRTTGNDFSGDGTSSKPFQSLAQALSVIPDGYVAQVYIDLDANTYVLPDYSFTPKPGSGTVAGAHQGGKTIIRGVCSTSQTIALAKTWTLVSNRKAQVTSDIGAFTGTVTDGSNFVRIGTASPYTYRAVRASTTPNLVVVSPSVTSYLGELCTWGTTLSGSNTFSALLGPDNVQHVQFEAIKFSGSPSLNNVKLYGTSIATPSTNAGSYANVDMVATYLGAVSNMVGFFRGTSTFTESLSNGCMNLYGFWSTISGVIDNDSPACSYAQLNLGGPIGIQPDGGANVTGTVPSPPTVVRVIKEIDIEGTSNDCLYMSGAQAVLGSGHGEDLTCNPTTSGRFATLEWGSRFGVFSADSTLTGTVSTYTLVRNGSIIGPLNSAYSITFGDGGAFLLGTTVKGAAGLPAADATSLTRGY